MDRRLFLKSAIGVAGAAAAASAFASRAEALPLFEELKAMDAKGANPLKIDNEADLPAKGAEEAQYYYRRYPRRRYWGRPVYRRPVYRRPWARCRTFVNRWGRLVRRCF